MPSLTAATIVEIEQPRELQISADGQSVVYVTQSVSRKEREPKTTIWLAQVGQENSSKPLTKGDHLESSPSFSPDGSQVAFLSDRSGDMDIYFIPLQNSDLIGKATSTEGYGSVEAFKWNDKGTHIALNIRPKQNPKSDVKVHGENVGYRNLWLLDIENGGLERLNDETADVTSFDWSNDGGEIVYCTQADPEFESADYGQEVKVIDISTKVSKSLAKTEHRVSIVCWSGDEILLLGSYEMKGLNRSSAVLRLKEGCFETVACGKTNDAISLKVCSCRPLILLYEKMRCQIQTLDRTLYDVQKNISGCDAVFDGDKAILTVIMDEVGIPPEVYSIKDGQECKLSQHGEHIAKMELGKGHVVEYSENGVPYDGCYSVPAAVRAIFDAKEPLPTVVVVHGGPHDRSTNEWDNSFFFLIAPYLMGQGYLVLTPNYRGGSGHGDEYAFAVNGQPDISYEDVVWLVRKGIEERRIDKDRVAIAGWSQGGYVAYQAVARDSTFHFTAAVAGAGVSDWYVATAGSDLTLWGSSLLGYLPWDQHVPPEKLKRNNPIHRAKDVQTPLLIVHGEADRRVSPLNATIFSKALKFYGKEFEMAMYPREGHGIPPYVLERAHLIDFLERMGGFFKKYLKV